MGLGPGRRPQEHGEVAHHQVGVAVQEGAIDGHRARGAVVHAHQRIGMLVDVDDLMEPGIAGQPRPAREAEEDRVHLPLEQGVDLGAAPIGAAGTDVRDRASLTRRDRHVDEAGVGRLGPGEPQGGHEAVQGRAALEVDEVPVQRERETFAREIADRADIAVRPGEDPLVLVEPGDADDRGVGAARLRPDRRDVAPLPKQAGDPVVVVSVADAAVLGVTQRAQDGAASGELGLEPPLADGQRGGGRRATSRVPDLDGLGLGGTGRAGRSDFGHGNLVLVRQRPSHTPCQPPEAPARRAAAGPCCLGSSARDDCAPRSIPCPSPCARMPLGRAAKREPLQLFALAPVRRGEGKGEGSAA